MQFLKLPQRVDLPSAGHEKWLKLLNDAELLVNSDADLQAKVAKGLRLKERRLPPEVLGRMYAQYCSLINNMYDTYLNNMQLQRAPYILDIIRVIIKRIYELRNELVHFIVNDYIYVDTALIQMRMIPQDIQIVIPHHFPLEARPDSMEDLFQKMYVESYKRLHRRSKKKKPKPEKVSREMLSAAGLLDEGETVATEEAVVEEEIEEEEEEEIIPEVSVHTIVPEEYINAILIQKHERYRQFFVVDHKDKETKRKTYFAKKVQPAPKRIKKKAAQLVQNIYRVYMSLKRKHIEDIKRDILLGIIPDVERKPLNYTEESNKLYALRRKKREQLQKVFNKQFERENFRMIVINKDNQIDDITEQIRVWFMHWYYGYGFFPQFPYEAEGGTILVITGQYPTIEEQEAEDERYKKLMKGKTKDMIAKEKQQAKFEAQMKAELDAINKKKQVEALFKARCNPNTDPGYDPKQSAVMEEMIGAIRKYQQAWSFYDEIPVEDFKEIVYGYMVPLMREDIMNEMHLECRKYVDQLMRLELKLLVKAQQTMYRRVDWPYPKFRPRKRPKPVKIPKPFEITDKMLSGIGNVFDLGIMSRPTAKIHDIEGDLSYIAYDYQVEDPIAKYPSPGYGDIKRRLVLSCIFGAGMEPSAKKNKAVLLLGMPKNGKSFLVDTCAGEMNAIKFDITPEVFTAVAKKPAKLLAQIFNAARVFQPAVIFLKDIERVFYKKVPPQDKHLKSSLMKKPLGNLLKTLLPTDKVIFIATCSNPFLAQIKPMVKLFNEIILVPKPDYGSIAQFFYNRLLRIRSMPDDVAVHGYARLMEGYGFGIIIKLFDTILSPERIVRLNITPLSPHEFLEYLIEHGMEKMTPQEYQKYIDFCIQYSPLHRERQEYYVINETRKYVYDKLNAKKAAQEAKKEAAKAKGN